MTQGRLALVGEVGVGMGRGRQAFLERIALAGDGGGATAANGGQKA